MASSSGGGSLAPSNGLTEKFRLDQSLIGINGTPITFARTGVATNPETGVDIATGTPRYGVGKSGSAMYVEEGTTNVFTYSNDFRNTADVGSTRPWVYTNVTVTQNAGTDPYGASTATLIQETSANALHGDGYGITFVSGTTYTASAYFKAKERTKVTIRAGNPATWACTVSFDLVAVTATATAGSGTITNLGNGWFRCTATGTAGANAVTTVLFGLLDASGTASYAGDGTSGSYISFAQIETKAFATSYIPSVVASGVRNQETGRAPSATSIYTSDFSAGVNGATANGGAVAGNIDGIGGQNDNLRFTSDASTGIHTINLGTSALSASKFYTVTFSYYIPSANTTIKRIRVGGDTVTVGSTVDAWATFSMTVTGQTSAAVVGIQSGSTAASFTGTAGDLIYIRAVTVLECTGIVNNSAMTIAAWVNTYGKGSGTALPIFDTRSATYGTNDYLFRVYVSPNGTGAVNVTHSASNTAVASTTDISLNTWQHVAVTFTQAGGVKIYINGVLDKSDATSVYFAVAESFGIGCDTSNRMINGKVDGVMFYNRQLSATEIQQVYRAGAR
jgi:hypothetical protein